MPGISWTEAFASTHNYPLVARLVAKFGGGGLKRAGIIGEGAATAATSLVNSPWMVAAGVGIPTALGIGAAYAGSRLADRRPVGTFSTIGMGTGAVLGGVAGLAAGLGRRNIMPAIRTGSAWYRAMSGGAGLGLNEAARFLSVVRPRIGHAMAGGAIGGLAGAGVGTYTGREFGRSWRERGWARDPIFGLSAGAGLMGRAAVVGAISAGPKGALVKGATTAPWVLAALVGLYGHNTLYSNRRRGT